MRRIAQRTYHVSHIVTDIQFAKFRRAQSYFLYDQRDGAALRVGSSDGQRHTLTFLTYTYDDKIARLATLRNERCLDLKKEHLFRELFFPDDSVHNLIVVYKIFCGHKGTNFFPNTSHFYVNIVIVPKIIRTFAAEMFI